MKSISKYSAIFSLFNMLLLTATAGMSSAAKEEIARYYVSPQGRDSRPGTQAQPFGTPHRAQRAVRARIAAGFAGSIEVILQRGRYELEHPLVFGPEDSPAPGQTVTWRAPESSTTKGELPVLSGGCRLAGWRRGERENTWISTVPKSLGETGVRQLFREGERLVRARYPDGGEMLRIKSVSNDLERIEVTGAQVPAMAGSVAELVVLQNWSLSRGILESQEGNALTVATPMGWIGHSACLARPGMACFLENDPAFASQPEEWWFDAAEREIGVRLAPGEQPEGAEFIVPQLEQLIRIEGREEAPVRGLRFERLALMHAQWDLPQFGYRGIQAGYHGTTTREPVYSLPAAIQMRYAQDCRFEECCFSQMGATAIGIGEGCVGNAVEKCVVEDIGGNGIDVGHRPGASADLEADWTRQSQIPRENVVKDCHITRCGQICFGAVGVYSAFTQNTQIAHNEIHDLPYTGVSVGFQWNTSPTSQARNVVEYNHIYDVMKVLADGGCIYTLGWQPGTVLRGNRLHDVHRSQYTHGGAPNNGIFFDQGSKGILVEENVIYDTHGEPVRFNQCEREWQTWRDNTFGKPQADG